MELKYVSVCVLVGKCPCKKKPADVHKKNRRLPQCTFNSTCNQKILVATNTQASINELREARRRGHLIFGQAQMDTPLTVRSG